MFIGNKKILTGASVAVLLASGSVVAYANDARTANQNDLPHYTEEQAKQGLEDAKDAVSNAADRVSDKTKQAYQNIKDKVRGDDISEISPVDMEATTTTADSMIGQPVYDANGDRVAKVKDIILDEGGAATMIVLADGDWTGLGKLAAFDYDMIVQSNEDSHMIAPLTEEMIDNAAEFSYEANNSDRSVKVVPKNGFSVAELLDSKLVNAKGETVAVIDNITFRDGEAENLVVAFGQTLGLGGKQASMNFESPDIVKEDGKAQFKLSEAQTEKFEEYKKTSLN